MNRSNPIVDFAAKGYESRGKRIFAPKRGVAPSLVAGSSRGILSPTALEELFLYQRTANGAGGTGAAVFQAIKGNSIVWNQLADKSLYSSFATTTTNGIEISVVNGVLNLNGTAEETAEISIINVNAITWGNFTGGHKVIFRGGISNKITLQTMAYTSSSTFAGDIIEGAVRTLPATTATLKGLKGTVTAGTVFNDEKIYPQIFDLTLGNMADWTFAQFNTFFPLEVYPYTSLLVIKNNCATGMVTDGLNQWDEEILYNQQWEGTIGGTATLVNYEGRQCNKNLIPVIPGQSYCIKLPTTDSMDFYLYYYDSSYILVERPYVSQGGGYYVFNIPSNVSFLAFTLLYTQTYANNICINLSGSRNGQYEPHWSDTTALPITTATGKLNGEGESVVISPNGLAGVGTSFDEAIVEKGMWTKTAVRRAKVDMGTLEWAYAASTQRFSINIATLGAKGATDANVANILCAKYVAASTNATRDHTSDKIISLNPDGWLNVYDSTAGTDAAAFKAAMEGVMLEYELATPKEYILDTPVPVVARVDESGTPMTAPFAASIFYPEQMDKVYLTAADFKNFLDAAVSGGAITAYTMEWNAATGSYDFTVNQAAATLAASAPTE